MMRMWNVVVVVEALLWYLLLLILLLLLLNPMPHFADAITPADYAASLEANETEIEEQVNWHISFHRLLHDVRFQLSPKISVKKEKWLEESIAGYPSPDQILEMKKDVVGLHSDSLSQILKEVPTELKNVDAALQKQQYPLWKLQNEERSASLVADEEPNAEWLVRVCKENLGSIRMLFLQSGRLLNLIKSDPKLASLQDLQLLSIRIVNKIVKLRNHTEELLATNLVPKRN